MFIFDFLHLNHLNPLFLPILISPWVEFDCDLVVSALVLSEREGPALPPGVGQAHEHLLPATIPRELDRIFGRLHFHGKKNSRRRYLALPYKYDQIIAFYFVSFLPFSCTWPFFPLLFPLSPTPLITNRKKVWPDLRRRKKKLVVRNILRVLTPTEYQREEKKNRNDLYFRDIENLELLVEKLKKNGMAITNLTLNI